VLCWLVLQHQALCLVRKIYSHHTDFIKNSRDSQEEEDTEPVDDGDPTE